MESAKKDFLGILHWNLSWYIYQLYHVLIFLYPLQAGASVKIWLDDERPAPEGWMWVKDPHQAICLLKTRGLEIEAMAFDHDLGIGLPTGYDVACVLEQEAMLGRINRHIRLTVHSANPVGAGRIKQALCNALESLRKPICEECQGARQVYAGCHHCDEGVYHTKCDSYYGKCKACS